MRHDVRATPTTCKWSATSYITRFARSPAANFLVFTSSKRFTCCVSNGQDDGNQRRATRPAEKDCQKSDTELSYQGGVSFNI